MERTQRTNNVTVNPVDNPQLAEIVEVPQTEKPCERTPQNHVCVQEELIYNAVHSILYSLKHSLENDINLGKHKSEYIKMYDCYSRYTVAILENVPLSIRNIIELELDELKNMVYSIQTPERQEELEEE